MPRQDELTAHLKELQLLWPLQQHQALAEQAVREHWTPTDYLAHLV